jgi:FdhE protein
MSTIRHKIACLSVAVEKSPEYAGIVPLFVELLRFQEKAERETGISFRVSPGNSAQKLQGGFPILSPEELDVDTAVCGRYLHGVIDVLKRMGSDGGEGLDAISRALDSGKLELRSLFISILERERSVITTISEVLGIPPTLLEYVSEIPLKAALEQFAAGIRPEECAGWQEGYCPVCGSRAGMAELAGEEGHRQLSCSACSFSWQYKRLKCPFCGSEDAEKLSYFLAGDGPVRVDSCNACCRYIKTRDSRKGNADVPLDVEDLLTIHLDLLAAKEGFERGK